VNVETINRGNINHDGTRTETPVVFASFKTKKKIEEASNYSNKRSNGHPTLKARQGKQQQQQQQ